MADTILLVVRPEKTLKEMFERTLMEIKSSGTKGVGLLINDIKHGSGRYGYGENTDILLTRAGQKSAS